MRANAYLKRQYRAILSYIGMILSLAGMTMFFPLFALIDWPGESVHISGFILPATLLSGAGLIIWKRLPVPAAATLTVSDGGVIVLLSWMITCLFSAWPFMTVAVSLPLMILGNLNFATAYLLFRGKFKRIIHNGEVMLFGVLTAIAALILWIFICRELYTGLGKSIRVAIFETVTALTTTGFSTTVYHDWATPGMLILLLLMLIGGGTCSTAGGLKQYRIYLLFRTLLWELRRPFRPRTSVEENYIWQGERKDFVDDRQIRRISLFAFIYLTVYMAGAMVLALHGYGLRESLFEFASALGTVGLSVGVATADAPASVLWVLIAGMLLGRLEFFVVIISAVKLFRDLPAITARSAY